MGCFFFDLLFPFCTPAKKTMKGKNTVRREKGERREGVGFVDGGLEPGSPIATSIVIGGYQMEDNLLEFDLVSSKLGFSSSLLLHMASCSHFRLV